MDDEQIDTYTTLDQNSETADETLKEGKTTRKNGLLNWLKPRASYNKLLRYACFSCIIDCLIITFSLFCTCFSVD